LSTRLLLPSLFFSKYYSLLSNDSILYNASCITAGTKIRVPIVTVQNNGSQIIETEFLTALITKISIFRDI
jgi:hypothetical protein